MTTKEKYTARVNDLIELADNIDINFDSALWGEFRASTMSIILSLYSKEHPYYKTFINDAVGHNKHEIQHGKGILKAIKSEIENGWIFTLKSILSAEIFTSFIEMAEHLLGQGYKDPAAVMIGSVLEEHIRQLCTKSGIPITISKDGKEVAIKADTLNAELVKANVCNLVEQKSVTSWLGLRNSAAHGKYNEYDQKQIELMLQGILDFINRNKI